MIAVIGLGNIGLAIGARLVDSGHDVLGIDLSPEQREAWHATTSLDAVDDLDAVPWEQVGAVFVVVRLTSQAQQILHRLATVSTPLTCFVLTTLELEFARHLQSTQTLRVVELPVSGGQGGATAGTLTVMAAGPLTRTDEELLMTSIAANLVRFDAYGQPTLAKLLNNVTGAYNARAMAAMLEIGEQFGLDPKAFHEVLTTSSGGSWMTAAFTDVIDDLLAKDVALLEDAVGSLPVVSLADVDEMVDALGRARGRLTASVSSTADQV